MGAPFQHIGTGQGGQATDIPTFRFTGTAVTATGVPYTLEGQFEDHLGAKHDVVAVRVEWVDATNNTIIAFLDNFDRLISIRDVIFANTAPDDTSFYTSEKATNLDVGLRVTAAGNVAYESGGASVLHDSGRAVFLYTTT